MVERDERVALLTRKQVYPGKVVDLWVERIDLPNGKTAELEILHHPGAAAVVPIDDEDRILMVRQYRHAAGAGSMRFPPANLTLASPRKMPRSARPRRRSGSDPAG